MRCDNVLAQRRHDRGPWRQTENAKLDGAAKAFCTSRAMSSNSIGNAGESLFEEHKRPLCYLELWRELSIRPSKTECHPDDLDMQQNEAQDDCDELMKRCIEEREQMNDQLPHAAG